MVRNHRCPEQAYGDRLQLDSLAALAVLHHPKAYARRRSFSAGLPKHVNIAQSRVRGGHFRTQLKRPARPRMGQRRDISVLRRATRSGVGFEAFVYQR